MTDAPDMAAVVAELRRQLSVWESFGKNWPPHVGLLVSAVNAMPGLLAERERLLKVVKEAERLVENIRQRGIHDNWKGTANALSALALPPKEETP